MQRDVWGWVGGERRKLESSRIVGRQIGRIEGIFNCVIGRVEILIMIWDFLIPLTLTIWELCYPCPKLLTLT